MKNSKTRRDLKKNQLIYENTYLKHSFTRFFHQMQTFK